MGKILWRRSLCTGGLVGDGRRDGRRDVRGRIPSAHGTVVRSCQIFGARGAVKRRVAGGSQASSWQTLQIVPYPSGILIVMSVVMHSHILLSRKYALD